MSKFKVDFKDSKLNLALDPNEDGQAVLNASLNLVEAIQEAIQRGESVELEGAKLVEFKFELTKLKLVLDTDNDGEKLLELELDLAEALDEVGVLKS